MGARLVDRRPREEAKNDSWEVSNTGRISFGEAGAHFSLHAEVLTEMKSNIDKLYD